MYSPDTVRPRTVRARYNGEQLETASNAKILTMCFDRLDKDLATARAAMDEGDLFTTNEELGHAQDLLGELATMLDPEAWEHAGSLLAVYDYLLRILAVANLQKDVSKVVEAQGIVGEIGNAFRAARESTAVSAPPTHATPTGAHDDGAAAEPDTPRFSVRA